ncbi:MAG: zinc-binding dehydrogenase, partial [Bacteroidota bacterium]
FALFKSTSANRTKNVAFVKSLGADEVIDYTQTDFTKTDANYDIIYDTIGRSTFKKSKRALVKGGAYLSPVLSIPLLFQMIRTAIIGQKKAKFAATGMLSDDILRQMMINVVKVIQLGKLRLVIDRRYALEDVVKAHQYVDSGRKLGNIVLIP